MLLGFVAICTAETLVILRAVYRAIKVSFVGGVYGAGRAGCQNQAMNIVVNSLNLERDGGSGGVAWWLTGACEVVTV